MYKHQIDNKKTIKEQGRLKMEKIDTDYKRRTWKI